MHSTDRFRINNPSVISENIDGEVVIINLDSGAYYSTDQVGAEVWGLLEAGRCVGEIVEAIPARYLGESEEIETALHGFLSELQTEELIVGAEGSKTNEHASFVPGSDTEKIPFQPPALKKYTDMKDMLLLDPIHDVEESGWPVPKPAEDAG